MAGGCDLIKNCKVFEMSERLGSRRRNTKLFTNILCMYCMSTWPGNN